MATTTTNNGWDIPQSTDLVKNGATAIATLGQDIDTAVGTGLLAWTAYTPTLTNITKGTGPTEAYHYAQLGKQVIVRGSITLGTGGTLSGSPRFSLPVNASTNQATHAGPIGLAQFTDASAPGTDTFGYAFLFSNTTVQLSIFNAAGTYLTFSSLSSTVPITWTVSDRIRFQFNYEAA